jgi:hypothetical protein
LRIAAETYPLEAPLHGWRALMSRHAAEYASPPDIAGHVEVCRRSADRALELDPDCEPARVALISILPLFRNWREAHEGLSGYLSSHPDAAIAMHDLAMVEMATGFPGRAKEICDQLRRRHPLTATLAYKAIYQNWSVGHPDLERIAEHAIALWPTHPAVWTARFWTLALEGRLSAAAAMLDQPSTAALWPPALTSFLRSTLMAKSSDHQNAREGAVAAALHFGLKGPVEANTALFALSLFGASEEALELCEAYYLGTGPAVPYGPQDSAAAINDQFRRVTQILFTPAGAPFRKHPRFAMLADRIGLSAYWNWIGRTPDYQVS